MGVNNINLSVNKMLSVYVMFKEMISIFFILCLLFKVFVFVINLDMVIGSLSCVKVIINISVGIVII